MSFEHRTISCANVKLDLLLQKLPLQVPPVEWAVHIADERLSAQELSDRTGSDYNKLYNSLKL